MNGFKREMLRIHDMIKALQENPLEELSDDDYDLKWYENNNLYKWYLIRMEQWLGDINCNAHSEIYDLNIEAQRIGKNTGYYWNKISKKLFEIVEAGGL